MVFSKKHSVRVGAAHRESQASVASGVLRATARLFERCHGGPGGNASAVVRGKTRPDESTAQETHGGRRRQVTLCKYCLTLAGWWPDLALLIVNVGVGRRSAAAPLIVVCWLGT